MLLLSQTPGRGALSRRGYALSSPSTFPSADPPLFFSKRRPRFKNSTNRRQNLNLTLATSDGGGAVDSASAIKPVPSSTPPPPLPLPLGHSEPTLVGPESVPLEGVIQFDKPSSSSRLKKWGRVGLLAGGDVLALLLFSAIGRFSHGFSVFDFETLHIADPFIAGWFLSAYFLGGYGEDGRGENGLTKAVLAAAKSWSLGIPLGLIIRGSTLGHLPPYNFVTVTVGSTAVLLIGWRTLFSRIFPNDKGKGKKNDMYKRGSPFELFELLTSLVRRW